MSKFEDVPFPEYESDPEVIALLYVSMWSQVNTQVNRLSQLPEIVNTVILLQLQMSITRELTKIFNSFLDGMLEEIEDQLSIAYREGLSYSSFALGNYDSLEEAKEELRFTRFNERKLEKMITDTQGDLLKATQNTEENVKRLIRTTVQMAMRSTGGRNVKRSNMADKIKEELERQRLKEKLDRSNIAIIDKAKRRWKLDTYINMVAKTKMNTAYMDGIRDEAERDGGGEAGTDLAIISTKPDTYDACLNFEGMVISLNGNTPGYPTYAELKRSKLVFHPNCGHFCRPVPSIDFVPKEYMNKHNSQMRKYRKWLEGQSA